MRIFTPYSTKIYKYLLKGLAHYVGGLFSTWISDPNIKFSINLEKATLSLQTKADIPLSFSLFLSADTTHLQIRLNGEPWDRT